MRSYQLPSQQVAPEFGEVNLHPLPDHLAVEFTLLMEPMGANAEGWQTGVALDASRSMRRAYGVTYQSRVPRQALERYQKKGWITSLESDGVVTQQLTQEAMEDALARGWLKPAANELEPLARDFLSYLANNLDADGGTTLIYWACAAGDGVEVVGDITGPQVSQLAIAGPKQHGFGEQTRLLPALRYFAERFRTAPRGLYLFLTDGRIDDLDAVMGYTKRLAQQIAQGQRPPLKCVLIGVGQGIDREQLALLDDMDSGTAIDLWDHKIAAEMRELIEIFAEVVDEHQIIATSAQLLDHRQQVIKRFNDGLPLRVRFTLPRDATGFELVIGAKRIHQPLPPLEERA